MIRLFRNGILLFLVLVSLASALLAVYSRETPTYIAFATDISGTFNQQPVILGEAYDGIYVAPGAIGFIHHSEVINDPENAAASAISPRSPHLIWDHSDNPAATFQGSASLDELSYVVTYTGLGTVRYSGEDNWLGGSQDNHGWLIKVWIFILVPLVFIVIILTIQRLFRRRLSMNGLCPNCRYDLRVQLEGRAAAHCPECGRAIPDQWTENRRLMGAEARQVERGCGESDNEID